MDAKILVNHVGFLCHSEKRIIVKTEQPVSYFEVQDMSLVAAESFDDDENWQVVYSGKLIASEKEENTFVGNFSEISAPGVYSVVVPELKERSFQFIISDGAFHHLPWLFADYLDNWRGTKESPLKIKSTTDDGIRSDNNQYHPVKSGWYDAGDLRKWMTHTNLPAIGFYDLAEKNGFRRNYFHEKQLFSNDLLTVSDEAVNLILEMQDPETGQIFECLGAGGFGRADEGMSWWYENHSGCLADNSDNRFTDNRINSGDERTIRTDYNALIQYTSIYILLRAHKHYKNIFPEKADRIQHAVQRILEYTKTQMNTDPLEKRTAIKSWKLMAYNELFRAEFIEKKDLFEVAESLLQNYEEKISFWCMDENGDDPYRGILHSAQPIISLLYFYRLNLSEELNGKISNLLMKSWENYIYPLLSETSFGFMPYGIWFKPATEKDSYTPWKNDSVYRKFMPAHSKQKINHGLNGHYTSWAHALALLGSTFQIEKATDAAWNQIYFTLGMNDFSVSFVSGVGYNNPMPHSRFLGTVVGGFMAGFIGNTDDSAHVDLKAKAQWNSTEYWNTPIANLCMALAELLPETIKPGTKLGKKL